MNDVLDRTTLGQIQKKEADPVVAMIHDLAVDRTLFEEKIERIEGRLLELGWTELPVNHHFADGVYFREGTIPKGSLILGHAHKREDLTVFFSGRLLLAVDGVVKEVHGPCVVKTPPGARKIGYVLEETRGGNIHANPSNERDISKVEADMVYFSKTYLAFKAKELT